MKKKMLCAAMTAIMLLSVCAAAVPMRAQGQGTEPSLYIEAQNVSFRDSVYLKYAVSVENAEAEDVTLLVWTQPEEEYTAQNAEAALTASGTATVGGKAGCLIFEYKDLAAKQMTDEIYVRAYTEKNATAYYSAVKKYSILQYCYNMLGKTGTASGSESLKALLQQMLAYGAAAQSHFDYKTDTLATAEFYQVKIVGGVLADGCDSGLYVPGTQVALTAPATDRNGAAFVRWENSAGASVGVTAELTYTVGSKNEMLTAVYGEAEPVSEGLEFDSNGDGTAVLISIGECEDTDVVIPAYTPDGDLVVSIEANAFAGSDITGVTIPVGITEIGRRAFHNCTSLTDVYYGGTEAQWEQVSIHATGNSALTGATLHCQAQPQDPQQPQEPEVTEPTIHIANVTAAAGASDVAVTVAVLKNPGVSSLVFDVHYSSALTLTSVDFDDQLTGAMTSQPFGNPVMLMWIGGTYDMSDDLTFATLHFDASAAPAGSYPITVTYDEDNIYNVADENVAFAVLGGGITVEG